MAKLAKFLQGVAGAGGGAGLNVEEVFSTYLYDGTGSRIRIQNDVNVLNEGGLVWIKDRTSTQNHYMIDTARGIYGVDGVTDSKHLSSNTTNAETSSGSASSQVGQSDAYPTPAIPEDGFYINSAAIVNTNGNDYASWTFRKAPKFFDVVTYTGDGTSSRQISHDLGTTVGMTVVKCTSNSQYWHVLHRSGNAAKTLYLNRTDAEVNDTYAWNSTHATSTHFTIGAGLNTSGRTYVAYLFAHNDGDGEFGPDGDADIIKCGSFTASAGTEVDLGFEPQWVIVKSATSAADWYMFDNIRGWGADQGSNDAWLSSNTNGAELNNTNSLGLTPTGFTSFNGGDQTYIYIAIRRGPMAVPESATDVFAMDYYSSGTPEHTSNFPVDMAYWDVPTSNWNQEVHTRILGTKVLKTHLTSAEATRSDLKWDNMDGYSAYPYSYSQLAWMWRRAPSYFDVVAYTGDSPGGVGVQTISHNLGVAPEMIWFKRRDSTGGWGVLVTALGTVESGGIEYGQGAYLNETSAFALSGWWGSPYVAPTATEFTVRGSTPNASGGDYIAYLFASLDGVSKVGSYTGNGSSQTIDCGFSSGARFVLIKGSSFADNWWVFDTERGIVTGDDPRLYLNTTDAEFSFDYIDPHSSGFTVNSFLSSNGQTYIFYAIA